MNKEFLFRRVRTFSSFVYKEISRGQNESALRMPGKPRRDRLRLSSAVCLGFFKAFRYIFFLLVLRFAKALRAFAGFLEMAKSCQKEN